jgi:hypothetical protein
VQRRDKGHASDRLASGSHFDGLLLVRAREAPGPTGMRMWRVAISVASPQEKLQLSSVRECLTIGHVDCLFISFGEEVMGRNERRNMRERGALVQRLIKGVLQNPSLTLSVETLQAWLNVPVDAAERILTNLVSAGLVREVGSGVWVPGPLSRASY